MNEERFNGTQQHHELQQQPQATKDIEEGAKSHAVNVADDFQHTSIGDHGRLGLSTSEAEVLYKEIGFNELEHVEISAFRLFFLQFTGMMPYILEIACVLALGVQDYIDFAIIFLILLSNALLGYFEEVKAKNSLVRLSTWSFETISS